MISDKSELAELMGEAILHCAKPFTEETVQVPQSLDSLPYHILGGQGLDLLCFQLLLADGYTPRYFGKPGQPQYGVDLVVMRDGKTTVYQCRNLRDQPTPKYIREVLEKFEHEWLHEVSLPQPERFVLCCPQPLEDIKVNVEWTKQEQAFRERTKVAGLGRIHASQRSFSFS